MDQEEEEEETEQSPIRNFPVFSKTYIELKTEVKTSEGENSSQST